MSTRHTGSRFALTMKKNCNLVNREDRKCCRFDSIRSIRDDSSALMSTRHTGSRFALHVEKNCNLVNREDRKCCRFDSIRSIRDDSSVLMLTRHTGSRFARHLEKNCNTIPIGLQQFTLNWLNCLKCCLIFPSLGKR